MSKNEDLSLEKQLKEAQKIIGAPGKKIVGNVLPILNWFNPLARNDKGDNDEGKKGKIDTLKHNNISWINVETPTSKEMGKLAEEYKFHPLYLDTALSKGQPTQIEREEKYLFLVFHVPSLDSTEDRVITDQVAIFLGKNYIVTIHDSASSVHSLFRECRLNEEIKESFFRRSSGYLLYLLVGNMIKEVENLIQLISQELDEAEDIVFDAKVSGIHKISRLRQKIIRLRRIIGSFKHILEELPDIVSDFTGDNLSRYYSNLANNIDKLRETTGEAIETVEVYKDADFTVSTEKTNQILAFLTILFTLFLPATVIGAFYGMNILLPGGIETGAWDFWGSYTTLIILGIASVIPVLLMIIYFKLRKWF